MDTKFFKVGVIIMLLLGAFGYYFYFGKNQTSPKSNQQPVTQLAAIEPNQTDYSQTVEDLLKKSVNEMSDPGKAIGANAKSSPVSDICVTQQVQTFSCYQDYYEALVKKQGVAAAFVDLKQRYDQNPYIMSQCHPITHVIGNAATLLYSDVGQAYAVGDSFCWSGYYHGVMEGIVGRISIYDLPQKLDGICANIPGKASYSFDYYNCVHGIGHGVMAITQDELFDSLKLCDNLTGNWEQSSCHGGAFMENVIVDNKNHFTKYLKPAEPLYPCSAVDDKYKGTCYLMQTSYMLKVTNSDFKKVFDLCSTVGNYAPTCYQSLGRDASGRSISNAAATNATCSLGKDFDQKSNCIIGAVKDFISYHHSDVQAKQLCASLEAVLQPMCYSTTESYYKTF